MTNLADLIITSQQSMYRNVKGRPTHVKKMKLFIWQSLWDYSHVWENLRGKQDKTRHEMEAAELNWGKVQF